jgi:hypothetical protein
MRFGKKRAYGQQPAARHKTGMAMIRTRAFINAARTIVTSFDHGKVLSM